jgi:hypothetical protein
LFDMNRFSVRVGSQLRDLRGQFVQQLEAAAVFRPFLLAISPAIFFPSVAAAPAPGAIGYAINRLPELIIAGVEMAPLLRR